MTKIPSPEHYMRPTIDALRALGGSATISELYEYVTTQMGLTDEQLALLHNPERGTQTKVGYQMAWARTCLKKTGYIDNSKRGVWTLTKQGHESVGVDPQAIAQQVRQHYALRNNQLDGDDGEQPIESEESSQDSWRSQLMTHLQQMPPDAFARLSQRILRECGFVELKVMGHSDDGGIDGIGILRVQSVVSFHVLFQCKPYKGAIDSPAIRVFRGAMVGRSDKGIFITRGTFTREAHREATRDGAPPIDLIDGERLLDLMKEFDLGTETKIRTIEEVTVDVEWLRSI